MSRKLNVNSSQKQNKKYYRPFNVPLARFSPHLSTISESPLSNLRRYSPVTIARRPRRTIDTADIDVSTPRTLAHENSHQRHHLRRDRPTIKIRSQALKDNPALREHYEKHEKNVGEMLVEKFLIKEKKYDRDNIGGSGLHLPNQHQQQQQEEQQQQQQHIHHDQQEQKQPANLDCDSKNALVEAIQRRVTRRFTRRRSSADVQLNSEQLERELAYAQVQAEVLDTLVAEEQAEMEVEARKAFAKKKTHRSAHNLPQVEVCVLKKLQFIKNLSFLSIFDISLNYRFNCQILFYYFFPVKFFFLFNYFL